MASGAEGREVMDAWFTVFLIYVVLWTIYLAASTVVDFLRGKG